MVAAIVVCFLLFAAVVTVGRGMKQVEGNKLINSLRIELMRDNVDYDVTDPPNTTRTSPSTKHNRFVTISNPSTAATENPSNRYDFNRFKIVYRPSVQPPSMIPYFRVVPEFRSDLPKLEDPLERSDPEKDDLQTPELKDHTSLYVVKVSKKSRLQKRVQPKVHKRKRSKVTKHGKPTRTPVHSDANYQPRAHQHHHHHHHHHLDRLERGPAFRSNLFYKMQQFAAYRYVPTTRPTTSTSIYTFKTNSLPSLEQLRNLNRLQSHVNKPPAIMKRSQSRRTVRVVQPTPNLPLHTEPPSTPRTTGDYKKLGLTLQRRYWTVKTRNPLYKEQFIVKQELSDNKEENNSTKEQFSLKQELNDNINENNSTKEETGTEAETVTSVEEPVPKAREDKVDLEAALKKAMSRALARAAKMRRQETMYNSSMKRADYLNWKYIQSVNV